MAHGASGLGTGREGAIDAAGAQVERELRGPVGAVSEGTDMKRRLALAAALAAVPLSAGVLTLSPAVADSPISFEPGGPGLPHSHHVHTGDGGCVEIDSVFFLATGRGLHHGANMSGPEAGPWHGTCDGWFFPGSTMPAPPHPGH